MKRRDFLAASGVAGLASWGSTTAEAAQTGSRDYYLLQQYQIEGKAQKDLLDAYLRDAAIPALNRLGCKPVGVFYPQEDASPIYVLLRHNSAEVLATLSHKLLADVEYLQKGAKLLDAPASEPAFKRLESSLLLAFKGMPELQTPITAPGRVFQLRIYESPSVKTGQKKIEMFNDAGEIEIFRRVGLHAVFFGEALVGTKMPNLTYMLVFENMDEQKANWKKFGADPGWKKLRTIADYADKTILCGITNLFLKPADYSQV